jgi:hypothetical protein
MGVLHGNIRMIIIVNLGDLSNNLAWANAQKIATWSSYVHVISLGIFGAVLYRFKMSSIRL